jgi:hypothetical protein
VSVIAPPPLIDPPDAGVIQDARDRQRRRREAGNAISLVVLLAAVLAYYAAGGGTAVRGAPGFTPDARASVAFVSWRTPGVDLVASPSLAAGTAGLCVSAARFEPYGSCETPQPYPQAGIPLETAEGGFPIEPVLATGGAPPASRVYVLLTAPNVSAVRVGGFATIAAQDAPGLPRGDRMIAFRLAAPSTATVVPPGRPSPSTGSQPPNAIVLTALDSSRRPVSVASAAALNRLWLPLWPHVPWPPGEFTAATGAACAVSNVYVPGAPPGTGVRATQVMAQPAAATSAYLNCLNLFDANGNDQFQVIVLLNARHPGRPPAQLWGAEPVPGHPGVVALGAHDPLAATIVARRDGNAWLILGHMPDSPGQPTLAELLRVLAPLQITRI